jgi:hypothetical protein
VLQLSRVDAARLAFKTTFSGVKASIAFFYNKINLNKKTE